MDAFRQRHAQAKEADDARNKLIEDLLQKVDGMQKKMDRNAFVMVLIDGDCMNFQNELVKQGMTGGDEAAKLLRQAVFKYLDQNSDFKHDTKIVIRVYANLRGLSKTYVDMGILPHINSFAEFVIGFNKAHPLFDFVDAGNHKEAADTKLKEILDLYVYNVHCKQIVFGGSSDNAYASFLSSHFLDTDVSTHIRLLKGPPFSYEFKNIISRFQWTEFKHVFRSEFITKEYPQNQRRSQEIAKAPAAPVLSNTSHTTSMPWRPKKNLDLHTMNIAFKKADTTPSPDLIEFTSPKLGNLVNDSDGDDDEEVAELDHARSPASSTGASGRLTPLERTYSNPTADDVKHALVECTERRLKETPLALDFGAVKKMVEQELGLTPDFLGKKEGDEWYLIAKNTIKVAVEEWVHRTGNPPPKNATWMMRFVNNRHESSSPSIEARNNTGSAHAAIHEPTSHGASSWSATRTTARRPSTTTSINQPTARTVPDRIFLNSAGQRIDIPTELTYDKTIVTNLRDREQRFCNVHHLLGECYQAACPYDHDTELTDAQFEALQWLARSQRCPRDSDCTSTRCTRGHMCPNGTGCTFGTRCTFADLHGIDTVVVAEVMG